MTVPTAEQWQARLAEIKAMPIGDLVHLMMKEFVQLVENPDWQTAEYVAAGDALNKRGNAPDARPFLFPT